MCRQHSTKEIRTWFSGKLRNYGSGIGGAHIEYHNEGAVRAEFYTLPTHRYGIPKEHCPTHHHISFRPVLSFQPCLVFIRENATQVVLGSLR